MRNREYLDDSDDVVRDGERVRIPLYLMDSVQRAVACTWLSERDRFGAAGCTPEGPRFPRGNDPARSKCVA